MKNQFQDARSTSLQPRPSSPAQPESQGCDDDELLARASRLLQHIREPGLLRVARGRGYSQDEHEAGWALYRRASGDRDLVRMTRTPLPPRSAEHSREYRELAAFGELWFARTRAILRRVVPLARRDGFEAELFADLTPDGDAAALSRSLRAYLDRVAALSASGAPGARTLSTMLTARGLNEVAVAMTRTQLDALDALAPAPALPSAPPGADAAEALVSLGSWYRAWAGALRGAFSAQQCAHLGIAHD